MFGWKDLNEFDFNVITLFEKVQLEWLYEWKNREQLGILMNHYPSVSWYMKHKAPNLKEAFDELEQTYKEISSNQPIKEIEKAFLLSLEDWIIYVTEPDCYDKLSFNKWDDQELLSITDFQDKVVVDIGSGTGSQLFRIAPHAKEVYAVEPIGHLRTYLKDKAKKLGFDNCYVMDGVMLDIPFPNEFADIVVSGHVFGDHPLEELKEIFRAVKVGGYAILMPGNNDVDNDAHQVLLEDNWSWDRFLEPGPDAGYGWKRKYWKKK